MKEFTPLTDMEWSTLEPLFPKPEKRSRGKPHTSWRFVVNAILLVLKTKIKWSSIPTTPEFATKSAAHRWFLKWDKTGFLDQILSMYKTTQNEPQEFSFPSRRERGPKEAPHVELVSTES